MIHDLKLGWVAALLCNCNQVDKERLAAECRVDEIRTKTVLESEMGMGRNLCRAARHPGRKHKQWSWLSLEERLSIRDLKNSRSVPCETMPPKESSPIAALIRMNI